MSIKPLLSTLLFTTLILLSLGSRALASQYIVATPIQSKLDTGGRAVSLDSALACIDRYPAFMAAHGFAAQAGQPINIRLRTTSQITTSESFSGKDLQDWLNKTAADYAATGKTLMIKVALGVYDMNYLNTYQPNAALRTANNNRIAIFIIPYDAISGQPVKMAAGAQPMGGTGGGGTGYDLGGVQP